jgi:uncharacterized Ntn-hydrolase superfamily protein
MTYTILGHCSRTGALGLGVATYSLAVGGLCPAVRSNVGVVTSQAFVNPELRGLGATLLASGFPAAQTLEQLKAADPKIDYRQIGVLDRFGRGAAFTGTKTRPWTGDWIGEGYLALGNVLAGEHVIHAMAEAFENFGEAPLAERLLLALEAGRDAGGQVGGSGHLPERSAALLVHGRGEAPEIDLRVDLHERAVDELRRLHDEYAPYVAFHRRRWLDPASAPPQEQFVAELNAMEARQ